MDFVCKLEQPAGLSFGINVGSQALSQTCAHDLSDPSKSRPREGDAGATQSVGGGHNSCRSHDHMGCILQEQARRSE